MLGVDVSLTNNSDETKSITPYLALYKNNLLIEAKMLESQLLATGEMYALSENFIIDKDEAQFYSIRVFNWDNTFSPITESFKISGAKEDYYGDSHRIKYF